MPKALSPKEILPHKTTEVELWPIKVLNGQTIVEMLVSNWRHPKYDPDVCELGTEQEEAPNRQPIILPVVLSYDALREALKSVVFLLELLHDDDGEYYQIVASVNFGEFGAHPYILWIESQPGYFRGRDVETVRGLFQLADERKFLREVLAREKVRHEAELASYRVEHTAR